MTDTPVIIPPFLKSGDCIAIVSPSGWVKKSFVNDAVEVLGSTGFSVEVYPHTTGRNGTFSGTADERFYDLSGALTDPAVKAVLCSRGGYGAIHLLEKLQKLPLRENAKWIIGFSDITALHALMSSNGICSIHGPMTKHLANFKGEDSDGRRLLEILKGDVTPITFNPHPLNSCGKVKAPLYGGNLAVMMGLLGTPWDIVRPGSILFIEDVSEPVYKVERMIYQLYLSGRLSGLKGLVVGQFTEYSEDINHESMESMISNIVGKYNIPIAFNAPIGHVDHNVSVIEGVETILDVNDDCVRIIQQVV